MKGFSMRFGAWTGDYKGVIRGLWSRESCKVAYGYSVAARDRRIASMMYHFRPGADTYK